MFPNVKIIEVRKILKNSWKIIFSQNKIHSSFTSQGHIYVVKSPYPDNSLVLSKLKKLICMKMPYTNSHNNGLFLWQS